MIPLIFDHSPRSFPWQIYIHPSIGVSPQRSSPSHKLTVDGVWSDLYIGRDIHEAMPMLAPYVDILEPGVVGV